MREEPVAAVALARCKSTLELFAVRFEEVRQGGCKVDWAFRVKEIWAQREGYDTTSIPGITQMANDYPGCPSCSSRSIMMCGCGKLTCHDGESDEGTCAWCGYRGRLQLMTKDDRIRSGIDI